LILEESVSDTSTFVQASVFQAFTLKEVTRDLGDSLKGI
jgi:hypothetical protein